MTQLSNDLQGGCIVLAAFQPEPASFAKQIRSIAQQTRTDWTAIISADSDVHEIATMVQTIVGHDPRFRVVGSGRRLGYYRNFEQGLWHVPPDARWVALADQDDEWYPHKLERLVPELATASAVSGQAILSGDALTEGTSTRRRVPSLDGLLIDNQVTGSFTVFRREVLSLALPFPSAPAGAFHDHWLGICAAVSAGFTVVDEPLQRYIQHGSNVIGEATREPFSARLGRLVAHGWEESRYKLVHERLGWRRDMAATLKARMPPSQAYALTAWAEKRGSLTWRLARAIVKRDAPAIRTVGLAIAIVAELMPTTIPKDPHRQRSQP